MPKIMREGCSWGVNTTRERERDDEKIGLEKEETASREDEFFFFFKEQQYRGKLITAERK